METLFDPILSDGEGPGGRMVLEIYRLEYLQLCRRGDSLLQGLERLITSANRTKPSSADRSRWDQLGVHVQFE